MKLYPHREGAWFIRGYDNFISAPVEPFNGCVINDLRFTLTIHHRIRARIEIIV